jgi:hypothetical protein
LKIHGRWDQPDHSGASFAGQCKDGKGWKGTVRLRDEAVYALGMQGSDPKQGAYEGFVYSFEFTK